MKIITERLLDIILGLAETSTDPDKIEGLLDKTIKILELVEKIKGV